MGIYKRGETWTVRLWIDGQKVEKAVGTERSLALAMQKELEAEVALANAAGGSAAAYKVMKSRDTKTLAEAFADYMRLRKVTIKPSTKRTYEENFRAHLQSAFGNVKVSKITKYQIADFQNELAASRSATRTNNVMNLLRSILKHCVEEDLIPVNPAAQVKRLREEAPDIDPLTLDELESVLLAIPEYYRQIFAVLAFTGMRPNELKALRWSDIDYRRNEIKITKGRVKGVESSAKTRSSKRIIPMHPRVVAALNTQKSIGVPNINGYVFTSKRGEPIKQHLDVLWTKAVRRSGMRHRPCYQLRHTWASMALEAGESPGWVAKMMGHSDLESLFRHYARFIPCERNGKLIASVAVLNATAGS